MTTEARYALPLTLGQMNDLIPRLDASAASEADPAAPIFALLDQVRALRKKVLSDSQAQAACQHDYNEFTPGSYCVKCGAPEPSVTRNEPN